MRRSATSPGVRRTFFVDPVLPVAYCPERHPRGSRSRILYSLWSVSEDGWPREDLGLSRRASVASLRSNFIDVLSQNIDMMAAALHPEAATKHMFKSRWGDRALCGSPQGSVAETVNQITCIECKRFLADVLAFPEAWEATRALMGNPTRGTYDVV